MPHPNEEQQQPRRDIFDDAKELIEEQHERGELDEEHYERLLAKANRKQEDFHKELDEIYVRNHEDPFDTRLEWEKVYNRYAGTRRSIEFEALGINLSELAVDYDNLIRNLQHPEIEKHRSQMAGQWRALTPEQQRGMRRRMIDDGACTAEEFDHFVEDQFG